MGNIWDNEEAVSEYDMISEDAQQAEELAEEYANSSSIEEADEEALETISEESAFRLDKNESKVIYNARLRLEQAKLYEMLINHNLFDGVDASPEAINNVQNELKFYIVKRLEILLGIREQTVRVKSEMVELPFNDIEIDFLKQLAYKGTLGASLDGRQITPKKIEKQMIKPLVSRPPSTSIKTLSSMKTNKEEPPAKKAPPQPKKTVKAPVRNSPRKKEPPKNPPVKVRESGMGRTLTPQEAEAIAKADIKNSSSKSFSEMTAKEKAKKIEEVNQRYKRPEASNSIPMPSINELEMKYMNQQTNRSNSNNQTDQFNLMLANALAVQKNKGDQYE